jgi:hypothetical protein
MPVKDYNADPDLNTQISGINIAEGCAPSGINNAIRQLMADVKEESEAQAQAVGEAQAQAVGEAGEAVSTLDTTLRALIAEEVAKCLKTSGGTMTGPLNLGGHGVKDAASLELTATEYGGHIDFHFDNSTQDYTTRIIEQIEKRLDVWAKNGLTVNGHPVITSSLDVQFIAVGNNKTLTAPSGGTWVCIVLPWRTDGVNSLTQFQWFSTGGKIAKVAGGTALRTCGSSDAAVAWCFRVA